MNTTKLLAVIFSILIFSSCSKDFIIEEPAEQLSAEKTAMAVQADNDFAIDLLQQVASQELPTENLLVSPTSVLLALGMTLNGAEGDTKNEMEDALGFDGLTTKEINIRYDNLIYQLMTADPKVSFEIANSIWYRDGFAVKPEFLDVNDKYFDAEIKSLDFAKPKAKDEINDWVKDKTKNKISKIIDEIKKEDVMFLINAIYFKGDWKYEFDKSKTRKHPFKLGSGATAEVDMMSVEEELSYYETENFQLVDLPYNDGKFTMTVLLPDEMNNVFDDLSFTALEAAINNMGSQKIVLKFPKLKMDYSVLLNESLKAMGMELPFSDAADLTGIADADLKISKVSHKTYIDIDEEGTEAAAVTSVGVSVTSVNPNQPKFMIVDKPYLIFLREVETGTIIFAGKVVNPAK